MSDSAHEALIAWPSKAAVNRIIPKSKIYEHAAASSRLKQLFVTEVEQVTWLSKLSPETINVSAKDPVSEIQILGIQLKRTSLHHDVLRCIDRTINHPILFELHHGSLVQAAACLKTGTDSRTGAKAQLSEYFQTPWLPKDVKRSDVPTALNLAGLYERLLLSLVPMQPRERESLDALIQRLTQSRALDQELRKAVSALEKEKQFNRRVELNATVRRLKSDIEKLGHMQKSPHGH